MSNGNPKRKRSDRVATVVLPPGTIARSFRLLREPPFLLRVGLCLFAALLMWLLTGGWRPPFTFRAGHIPERDIVAKTRFTRPDPAKTEELRRQRRSETISIYQHDVRPLVELRKALKDNVFQVLRTENVGELPASIRNRFVTVGQSGPEPNGVSQEVRDRLEAFKSALVEDTDLASFEKAVQDALAPYEDTGLLESLEHGLDEGSQTTILVHPVGSENFQQRVNVREVRIGEATADLAQDLKVAFQEAFSAQEDAVILAELVHTWLRSQKLPTTLSLNREATAQARDEAVASVEPVEYTYRVGETIIAGGQPLTAMDVKLLRREYDAQVTQMSLLAKLRHGLADLGMFVALYVLCGFYIFYHERRLLTDIRRFATILGLVVATVGLCVLTSTDAWRAEIIPLGIFGMTVAIAYERELALLLSAVVALVVSLSLGFGLAEFVILVASVVALILCLTRIRSRTKLIYVGMIAGVMTLATTLGVGTLVGQAFASPTPVSIPLVDAELMQEDPSFFLNLLRGAAWFGFCSLLTGLVMTGLLPFIEKLLDVQTDISLLELGDAAHPLLQELARRAPGTYNHSINVASLAEAAAESIGGNGLLVRVGAYFHDIGKMLKPAYFVENQGQDPNRHQSLVPAMSTLVIIAHVKDGADLARQHHLPQSIIDFIEQHHGTTLVEYFYRQATLQREEDPDSGEIEEANFRYPGPKPQTREAAVLMLSDAVESASRALVDPAPARLDNLVHDIAMKRLLDGQFDECGLTLRDLAIVEDSLAKSLTAVYHGRVKYPGQQRA